MAKKINVEVKKEESGARLDKFLSDIMLDMTRSSLQKIINEGLVVCKGKKLNKNYKIASGDIIEVTIPDAVEYEAKAEDIPLNIAYEDNDLIVVNKEKGMVVHPAAGNFDGTLVNALLYHCGDSLSGINGVLRPGIVHRIDKDTSGLLIVAKNDFSHKALAEQIKVHSFTRYYEAVVLGNIKEDTGTVNKPIGRHPVDRKKMVVTLKNSKEAVTHFEVISRYRGYTHLRLKLETGRTHQIRVHMASLGHPLAGDTVYGSKKTEFGFLNGQCLHAKEIGFVHPASNKEMYFKSELPEYFTKLLGLLTY